MLMHDECFGASMMFSKLFESCMTAKAQCIANEAQIKRAVIGVIECVGFKVLVEWGGVVVWANLGIYPPPGLTDTFPLHPPIPYLITCFTGNGSWLEGSTCSRQATASSVIASLSSLLSHLSSLNPPILGHLDVWRHATCLVDLGTNRGAVWEHYRIEGSNIIAKKNA